jgi:hypothetical protein
MSRKALENLKYDTIKAHMLDPDHSPLPADLANLLDRIVSLSKILDKNPMQKQAIALHRIKYPEIVTSVAYEDMRLCLKLFKTIHTFDFDFWQTWLINDIISNIMESRKGNTEKDRKVISAEHTNLMKAIGGKPENLEDPRRTEKHQFYILIQNNNQQIKLDLDSLQNLPTAATRELNRLIYGGNEITDADAEQIMNS